MLISIVSSVHQSLANDPFVLRWPPPLVALRNFLRLLPLQRSHASQTWAPLAQLQTVRRLPLQRCEATRSLCRSWCLGLFWVRFCLAPARGCLRTLLTLRDSIRVITNSGLAVVGVALCGLATHSNVSTRCAADRHRVLAQVCPCDMAPK